MLPWRVGLIHSCRPLTKVLDSSKPASKNNCSMTMGMICYRGMGLCIMRKPYRTPEYRKNDSTQWTIKVLR